VSAQPLGGASAEGVYYHDLAQIATYFHKAGCSRVALLDQLRAARLVAEALGETRRVGAIDQMLAALPRAEYSRSGEAWTVTIDGVSQTSVPTRAWESAGEPT
jgi:hypothetical protein